MMLSIQFCCVFIVCKQSKMCLPSVHKLFSMFQPQTEPNFKAGRRRAELIHKPKANDSDNLFIVDSRRCDK